MMEFRFGDWGSWGVGDFYKDTESELREALDSGENFDTQWHGFKKECEAMHIFRDDDGITVQCSAEMDEIFEQHDLFCDFLHDDEFERLTDENVNEIRELLSDGEFSEYVEESETIERDASFDEIVHTASVLIRGCRNRLDEYFAYAIGTTLHVLYGESEHTSLMFKERLNEVGLGNLFDSPWDSEIGII